MDSLFGIYPAHGEYAHLFMTLWSCEATNAGGLKVIIKSIARQQPPHDKQSLTANDKYS